MSDVKIIVKSSGYIPFIQGNGPILKPVTLPRNQVDTLKAMGFQIEEVSKTSTVNVTPAAAPQEPQAPAQEQSLTQEPQAPAAPEAPVTEGDQTPAPQGEATEVVTDEQTEAVESTEEVVSDETETAETEEVTEEVEEVVVNDENLSADAFYTEEFLTKAKCKTILENRGVEFDPNANAADLKQLVLDSNPEVEEATE